MNLSKLILKAIFFTALFSALFAFAINIFFEYVNFQKEKIHIKEEFLSLKKVEIKREVLKAYNYIDYRQRNIEKKIKNELITKVNLAYNIALSIYDENKDLKSNDEIKYLIVTALKNINYGDRGYYFINSNNGKAILFNKKSKLNENSNIWNLQDVKGSYIIQNQSKIALSKKEGFLTNYFVKPDLTDKTQYPKLTYVKNFEPFNWHIGMGEYIDDMENEIKNDILTYISTIRYGKDGYIFVNSLDKKALVFDGKKLEKPKNYPNDALFEQQLEAVKNSYGNYFFYKFKKLNTQQEFPKMAYVIQYDKWKWIIGSGIYIDEIDSELIKKEKIIKKMLITQTNTLIAIIFFMSLMIFYISRKISSYIDLNILNLVNSFENASKNLKEINTEKLTFKEFKSLAQNLNITLNQRNIAETKIKDYLEIINKNVIISSTDTKGIITEVNDAFSDISGYTKEELLGKSHNIVRHKDMPKEVYKDMWSSLKHNLTWSGELKNMKKNGATYWVKTTIFPKFLDNELIGYTAIRHDITDKKRVEYLSITDELTQLYNRRYFNTKIEEEINRAKRGNYYLSFLMLDIDYFKNYNDTYGHQEGDIVLQKIAKVLLKNTNRASDYAFRLGGEEFGIIFSTENEKESLLYANIIKSDIELLYLEHIDSKISKYVTASIGLVVKRGSEIKNTNELYKLADKALYKAKENGRNAISIASSTSKL